MQNYHKQYSILVCAASAAIDELFRDRDMVNLKVIRILKDALDEAEYLSVSDTENDRCSS